MVFSCKPVNECYEVLEGYKEQLEAAGLDLSILNPALETPKAPPLTFVQESQKKITNGEDILDSHKRRTSA